MATPQSMSNDPGPIEAPGAEPLSRRLREAALLGLLALIINLAGNGSRGLWDRDEPRYAGCTREMRLSGDYVHPTFNAEPRYHKPILIYWLMLAGTGLAGDNPFGARLVSALAGTATCLLAWSLGRRMFNPRVGRLAALMLATAPLFVYNAKAATTDATLVAFMMACQLALWELARAPSRLWAGVFWVGLSLATLTKGPVAPVFLGLGGLLSWWWGGPTACWARLRWGWGVPIFALLTAPWFIAIGIISRGDFYRVSMGYHVVQRMTTGLETHGGFPGYYLVLSLLVLYPWSALMPVAFRAAWSRRRSEPTVGFLLGWIVGPYLFLEIVRTKLIHYYLPSYPALALLGAWAVDLVASSEVNLRRWPLGRLAVGLLTGIGIGMTVGLLALAFVLPWDLRWPCLVLGAVLGAGTLFAMERFQAGAARRAAEGLVVAWSLGLVITFGWLGPAIDPYRLTPMVAERLTALAARERATPALIGYKAPGVVYEMGHPAPVLGLRKDLAEYVRDRGKVVAAVNTRELELLRRYPRIRVDVRGTVKGLDTENPLKTDPWNLAVIRSADGSGPVARGPEESLVE